MKKLYTIKELKNPVGSWLLGIILSMLFSVGLAFVAVWITIEQNETLYTSRQLQSDLDKKRELSAKLEVEHARLLSPYELEKKAQIIGMGIARSGQVRRINPHEDDLFTSAKQINQEQALKNKETQKENQAETSINEE